MKKNVIQFLLDYTLNIKLNWIGIRIFHVFWISLVQGDLDYLKKSYI